MKSTLTALLALGTVAQISTASAAPKISAQSIIVNPTQPDLNVSVRINKDSTGAQNPAYRVDEKISISATANRDAYVYLFNVNPDGSVDQILPNRLSGANFVKANTTTTFPAADANFTYTVAGPIGQNKVLALASLTPLNLDQISSFKTAQDQFATVTARGQDGLAQALSIVVTPLPQNSWVTDTAFYTVAAQNPVSTGSLFVGTNVSGATVIANGQTLGGANVTYSNLRAGTLPIRVRVPGYSDYTTTVTIRPGATTNVNVEFAQPLAVTPAPAPVSSTPVLDFIGGLLGAIANTQMQDPARSAYDRKVSDLQGQGYALQQSRQTNTGFVGTLVKGGSTVTVTVDRGNNRTVRVNVSETTTYRY
ncbi:hypothetical protein GCM10008959_38710 [Deinococcus seoulensis]|uniref:DUF4384 domain-containing protein n=2 Tax=Deinococcus TaxID=1298 RepID=A0ABQ2RWV7_9DEIO|nr:MULTISPECIES: DUF4384 domain-containing protein [Deinococcus]GGR73614.1 hypothetical protein GCM10008959_38710 [Deinococcus seoulensis]GGS26893.1 hypothetical protein GCM10008961_18000 [Deinococcus knuensis]